MHLLMFSPRAGGGGGRAYPRDLTHFLFPSVGDFTKFDLLPDLNNYGKLNNCNKIL